MVYTNKYREKINLNITYSFDDLRLKYINLLYGIEYLAVKQHYNKEKRAKKLLDKFKSWLIENKEIVPPKSLTGKAINYTLNIWDKLYIAGINDQFKLDNNLCENAIRPFALGRKNWLFAYTPRGAEAIAIIYSLIESAKLNGHNTYDYIYDLIEKIPNSPTLKNIEELLPYNWKAKPAFL